MNNATRYDRRQLIGVVPIFLVITFLAAFVLGLVLNTVILWNTHYIDAALNSLREEGYPVDDVDVGRLSPLGDTHINVHGRYAFTSVQDDGLRPLRDPNSASDDE